MANKYVRSGAGGAGTGADWANAYVTLTAAVAGSAAGDDIWVAGDHAESTAGAVTITFPGSIASPNRVLCVNHAGTVPPVSADLLTTGSVATTGANSITLAGVFYMYGLTISAGSAGSAANLSINSGNSAHQHFRNCKFVLNNTNTASRILLASTANGPMWCKLDNTTVTFGSTSQGINAAGRLIWINTASAIVGSVPTSLFQIGSTSRAYVYCQGVDFSAAGSGKTLCANLWVPGFFHFHDCKLGASVTVASGANSPGSADVFVTRSNDAAVAYRQEKYSYAGTETTETTIIRTGGAQFNGVGVAKKYVTSSGAKWYLPFEAIPISVANSTTGSNRVVTVYGIWGGGAVPNNDDIWFEVGYLGSALTPLATIATTTKADVLATGTATTSDSSTWGGSTTAFKMVKTLSSPQPAMAGEMYVQIYVGAASATLYIDPKVVLS